MARNHPRPRMKIRNKKRRHPTWRMTPEERELWYWLKAELRKRYIEELDKAILYGEGSSEVRHRWVEPHGDLTACGIRWWNGTRGEVQVTCPDCLALAKRTEIQES